MDKPDALKPVVQAFRNSYTAVLKSLHAFDLMTFGFEEREFKVSMARSRSSSSKPMLWIVFGSPIGLSGGGVMVEDVFAFLEGASLAGLPCFRLLFDLAMVKVGLVSRRSGGEMEMYKTWGNNFGRRHSQDLQAWHHAV